MARTSEGRALTRMHTKQQLALRAKVTTEVMRLYALWDLKDKQSFQRFQNAMVVVAQLRAIESATLAASYYEQFRAVDAPARAARAASRVALAAPPVAEQIRASVSATARAGVFRALRAGKPYEVAMQNGLVEVSGAVSRLALQGGRDTIEQAVMRDPSALGWARVASANACGFCAMLASRGPVYKEETVDFEAHDHCTCGSEPVYEGAEWPPNSKEYQDLWYDNHGSLKDFRAAVEGRTQ
jgi:hypothetical protein